MEQCAALLHAELRVVLFIYVDVQEPPAQGAKAADGVILELARRERRVGAEGETRRRDCERRAGELAGETAGLNLADESADALALRSRGARDAAEACRQRRRQHGGSESSRCRSIGRRRDSPGRVRE